MCIFVTIFFIASIIVVGYCYFLLFCWKVEIKTKVMMVGRIRVVMMMTIIREGEGNNKNNDDNNRNEYFANRRQYPLSLIYPLMSMVLLLQVKH